jgi:hypothetical protein
MKKVTLIAITLLLLVSSGLAQRGGGGNKPPANPAIATSIDGTQDTLKVMNADGSNLTTVYNAPNVCSFSPSWSPLGAGTQINPYSIAFSQCTLRVIDVAVVNGVPQGLNAQILADAADLSAYA